MCKAHSMHEEIKWMLTLVRKSERRQSLWRSRHRWKDNIEMHIKEIGCEVVD